MSSPQVVVREAPATIALDAADLLEHQLADRPSAVLAFPTGRTPLGFYEVVVERERAGRLSLAHARSFNLDEWVGLAPDHPGSYARFMEEQLFGRLRARPALTAIPNGMAADPDEECARYERAIADAGGFDLAVLGIGNNGHIGFNEPGTPFHLRTHVATVALETRQINAYAFPHALPPARACTVGIATILDARAIVLLATGDAKAQILARALTGPADPEVPASVLQRHSNVTVLADRAAAQLLPA
jgi:glucosamine-6-phosphate deaminase